MDEKMPLIKSKSKENLGKNIAIEIKSGKKPKVAKAIAFSVARKAGMKDKGKKK